MKSIFTLLCCMLMTELQAQITFIKLENSIGHAKFVGGDESGMTDNRTFSAGFILEHAVAGNMMVNSDHGRWYWGMRYRHLQATSINSIYQGTESHRYEYLELPLGVQTDWISIFDQTIVFGTDLGIFGTFPIDVEGMRTGPETIPWSQTYERPWFIFGFTLGLYGGINIADTFGFKAGKMGQFPFIPITTPAPEDYTGPAYKPQLLTDGAWIFTLSYRL